MKPDFRWNLSNNMIEALVWHASVKIDHSLFDVYFLGYNDPSSCTVGSDLMPKFLIKTKTCVYGNLLVYK